MEPLPTATYVDLWSLLEEVPDPEVPVLSVVDLGVVRAAHADGLVAHVTITPTYSGCPAMYAIEAGIKERLIAAGFKQVIVNTVLSPAWTTDWMSAEGRRKLEEYGIAPPVEPLADKNALFGKAAIVKCPQCKSTDTRMVSLFGSTACKAMYQCNQCLEPFDYFKCLR